MTHPTDDQILLHAYGELPDAERPELEAHLKGCAPCRDRFRVIEESRIALDWGLERRPSARTRRLAWLALPLAAGIGALILSRGSGSRPSDHPAWQPHVAASSTAGYVTGGATFIAIDSQLNQLEQRSLP